MFLFHNKNYNYHSLFLAMAVTTSVFLFFLLHILLLNSAVPKCPRSFSCQNLTALEFPLSMQPQCGLFTVNCISQYPTLRLRELSDHYEVLGKNSSNQLFVRDTGLQLQLNDRNCLAFWKIFPINPSVSFRIISPSLTIYNCENGNHGEVFPSAHFGSFNCTQSTVYYKNSTNSFPDKETSKPRGCLEVQLPIKPDQELNDLFERLSADFTLEWNISRECMTCHESGGQCSTNNMEEYFCRRETSRRNVVLAAGMAGINVLLICLAISFVFWIKGIRDRGENISFGLHKSKTESHMGIELFLKNNENLAPKRYTYSALKKMTNSFSDRLGEGGFGCVYKGKLHDGRLAAVKVLNVSKGSGEEFMNEVASISRTSHVNIVTLLGFCFEHSRRALIYEFMPNGSLEKFLHNTASSTEEGRLGWEKLYEIVIGISRGLEYLHQGCQTRILHLDIKPHNILLDKDLIPKISDFGLAKLCPDRASIISMVGARGTVGYIAPEIFCRNFGDVSHKSDVYSFGMLMLEMVGGTKNVDAGVERSSDIYFPDWIYKKLEVDANAGIGDEDEAHSLKRKLTIVGLWCIQTHPNHRPSITRVVEMLEENVESIQIPPRPYLFSPAKFLDENEISTFASSS